MNIATLVTTHPKTITSVLLLLLLAALPVAWQLQADRSISSFIPRGHISYDQKLAIQQVYNINDPLFVDVAGPGGGDIYTPEGLALVQRVSRFVEDLPGIRPGSVRSIDTHEDIAGSETGFDVRGFLDPWPEAAEQAAAVRERLKAFPLYDGLLISADGRRAGIIGDFEDGADVLSVFSALERLRAEIAAEGVGEIRASGPPIVTGTLNVYLSRDALTLNPVSAALTALLLFLALRSIAGVWLPLSVMLPAVTVCVASMPLMGFTFTPFSNAIPVVVLAVSIADAVHFLSGYYDRRLQDPGLSAREAVSATYGEIWRPIVITSVTTAAGFLMLIQGSPMIPVEQFGITVAIGVTAAMVFSLTLLPALVVWVEARPSAAFARLYAARAAGGSSLWDRFAGRALGRWFDHRGLAFGFMAAVGVVGAAGIAQLYADYEPVTFFPEDSHVRQDFYEIRAQYMGLSFIEVDIDTGVEDGVYEPEFLNRLADLQAEIEAWAVVGGTFSIADYLKKMNQAFHADDSAYYRISDRADANAQFFLLYNLSGDPRRFDEVTNGARSRANLRIFLKHGNHARSAALFDWLEQAASARFPEAKVTFGGEANVIHEWMSGVGTDVLVSVLLTSLVMFLIAGAFLRSVVGGLLLMIPVAAGILLTYAFIGFTGVPVGLGTGSFAAIAIGVGVDFAIHYLWRYRDERRAGRVHREATRRVMEGVGKAILFNALIVIGGFSVITLATTLPPQQIGMYVAISVSASLAATFVVLSVVTRWWNVGAKPATA